MANKTAAERRDHHILVCLLTGLCICFFRVSPFGGLSSPGNTGGQELYLWVQSAHYPSKMYSFPGSWDWQQMVGRITGTKIPSAVTPLPEEAQYPQVSSLHINDETVAFSQIPDVQLAPLFFLPIDINEAQPDVLISIPDIGPHLAEGIVGHRNAHGRFQRLNDLLQIKGIGRGKLSTITDFITINENPENTP